MALKAGRFPGMVDHAADDNTERAPIGYAGIVAPMNPAIDFRALAARLYPNASTTAIARELGHVTRHAVLGWIKGRHKPPAWVREIMIAQLFNRGRADMNFAALARNMPVDESPQVRGSRLASYRRAKEKAREAARAIGQTESENQAASLANVSSVNSSDNAD